MTEIAAKPMEDSNLKSLGNSEGILSGNSELEVAVADECTSSSKGIASICYISLLALIGRGEVWLLIGIF